MVKRRIKRKSNALGRYLQNPLNQEGLNLRNTDKLKTKNPIAEYDAREIEEKKPFVPQAAEPKSEPVETKLDDITVNTETSIQVPTEEDFTSEKHMPLYCNYCSLQKKCPYGKKAIKRTDQKELVICVKRKDFRQLVTDAGTNDRQGLLNYIHRLRKVNAGRISRLIYAEALSGEGQDRNLSLLIDKQIDNALAEYKILTPNEKHTNSFHYHLTQVHGAVDAFNELPSTIKQNLIASLKAKLKQAQSITLNPNTINPTEPHSVSPNLNVPLQPLPSSLGGEGGKFSPSQETNNESSLEDL